MIDYYFELLFSFFFCSSQVKYYYKSIRENFRGNLNGTMFE